MKKFYLNTKVCIVGSGFCGFAAYKEMTNNNIPCLLIEGGETKTPRNVQEQKNYIVEMNKLVKNSSSFFKKRS